MLGAQQKPKSRWMAEMHMFRRLRGLLASIGSAASRAAAELLSASSKSDKPAPDDCFEWFDPPEDPEDPEGWDQYWDAQIKHRVVGFVDLFVDVGPFLETADGASDFKVLCAGSGLSMEPFALGAAGLGVTVLDISPRAIQLLQSASPDCDALRQRFRLSAEATLDKAVIAFVRGSVLDPAVCVGPYDLIIERRTAQTYEGTARNAFLSRLAERLSPEGILFSHCHCGWWKPPDAPEHLSREWFTAEGWPSWSGPPTRKPAGRVAWLYTTTG